MDTGIPDEYDDPEYRTVSKNYKKKWNIILILMYFCGIGYHFGPNFFKLSNIGTLLEFSVGDKPVKNF